jgi:hypothetical protein
MSKKNTIQTTVQVPTITHSQAADLLASLGIELVSMSSCNVDLTLRLQGTISKGADTEAAATCKALSLGLVACLLRHCGVTRETALDKALAAIKAGKDGVAPEDTAFAEALKERIATELPKTPVAGSRTGKLTVEQVQGGSYQATTFAVTNDSYFKSLA